MCALCRSCSTVIYCWFHLVLCQVIRWHPCGLVYHVMYEMLPQMTMLFSTHVSVNISPFSFISLTPWGPITSSYPFFLQFQSSHWNVTWEWSHFYACIQDALLSMFLHHYRSLVFSAGWHSAWFLVFFVLKDAVMIRSPCASHHINALCTTLDSMTARPSVQGHRLLHDQRRLIALLYVFFFVLCTRVCVHLVSLILSNASLYWVISGVTCAVFPVWYMVVIFHVLLLMYLV